MRAPGAPALRWGAWANRSMSPRQWLSSPARERNSSPARLFGWTAVYSRARVGLIRGSRNFVRIVRLVRFLRLGVVLLRDARPQPAPVVELNPAKAAVV